MITKNHQNKTTDIPTDFASVTNIEVPAVNPNWQAPPMIQLTPYHYLAVLPAIITAATPLILGLTTKSDFLRKRQFREKQKQKKQQITENDNNVSD